MAWGRNLARGASAYREDTPFETTSEKKDNYGMLSHTFLVEPSTTYTIQVKVDGTYSGHQTSGEVDTAKKLCGLFLYEVYEGSTTWAGGYDKATHLGPENISNGATTGLGVWKYTTTKQAKTLAVRYNTYSDGSTPITVKFWDLKVEKGTEATEWTPAPEDLGGRVRW